LIETQESTGLACNIIVMFMFGFYFKKGYAIGAMGIEPALLQFNLMESYIPLHLGYYSGMVGLTAFKLSMELSMAA
jgi:hypothetical protein